jgi:hypothetical protein
MGRMLPPVACAFQLLSDAKGIFFMDVDCCLGKQHGLTDRSIRTGLVTIRADRKGIRCLHSRTFLSPEKKVQTDVLCASDTSI